MKPLPGIEKIPMLFEKYNALIIGQIVHQNARVLNKGRRSGAWKKNSVVDPFPKRSVMSLYSAKVTDNNSVLGMSSLR